MPITIPPVPYNTPISGQNGLLTLPWIAWYRQLFLSIGGNLPNFLTNPMTALGDLIVGGVSGSPTVLMGDTSNTRKFLRSLSVAGVATAQVWDSLTSGDIPALSYVTNVGLSVPASSIFGTSGTNPVTNSGTIGLTTSGTSGGIPYFSSTTQLNSSALLIANQLIIGGGAGTAPSSLAAGSQYQPLIMGATAPGYAALNLAQSAAITGVLPNANTTAASANTLSAIVTRDGSGNFTAGTITASLTGHASLDVATSSLGTLTEATNAVLTLTGWSNATVGSPTIEVKLASTSQAGYLSATDWNTFNGKQASGSYITALTGDGTASGPGSVGLTLATVNSNVGSFAISTVTVNAKGLVTAASAAGTTGSGNVVLATSPTLVTPVLGTPSSGIMTNVTGTASGLTAGNVTTNANLTGDVTSVGNATTIGNNKVTNAMLATIATQSFKGRTTASTGNVEDLSATQATAILNAMVGDSGSGGTKGLVPAPASGDAAAVKFLKADGTWAVPAGAGTVTSVGMTVPTALFATSPVSGSPVTGSGTLAPTLATQTAGTFFAGPATGSATTPTFRALQTPTVQKFTSGSGNYTTPAGVLYIRVKLVGAGGGGGGSSTTVANNGGTGGTGGTTYFRVGASPDLLVGAGGVGGAGVTQSQGGAGGTASLGSGPIGSAIVGGQGGGNSQGIAGAFPWGGMGAGTPFSGGGAGGAAALAGQDAHANTGTGGGGAGNPTAGNTGAGGGAGGYVDAIIVPTASQVFAYSIGTAGTAGAVGTSGFVGGAGGSGYVEVTEYYQ